MGSRAAIVVSLLGVVCACGWGPVSAAGTGTELPFHRGVNLTGWLQAGSAREIPFTQFTKQDFINIKSLGCDVIRLPINLHFMTDGDPNYTIDPLFFYFLDQVVDWCEELQIHLILDNHTFDVDASTDVNANMVLVPVWTQMAEHYKDRSAYLYYEVLNEPHGITDSRWAQIQKEVIVAIRAVDPTHAIVITGAGWGSYNNLKYVPVYRYDNLIYTFHFYDPFMFTHQGASWTDPSMEPLAGVPFPYGAGPMPACPEELKGTWIDSSLAAYPSDGTVDHVKELIDIAVAFRDQRQTRIFCGEFGVYRRNSDNDQRVYWYEIVREYLEEKGIPWTIWDYQGGFGLFNAGSNELFEHDLNVPMVEALGLTAPEQTPFVLTPDSVGFDLYADSVAQGVSNSGYSSQGVVDYYWDAEPAAGAYSIYCTGFARYNAIGFDFRPDKDLTYLVQHGSALDLWVRGDTPGAKIELRFLDTKTDDPADHPWRMGTAIDGAVAPWDSQWHHVQIPLSSFKDRGSWDGAWFNPKGAFDWSAVDRFEIVSEYHDFVGMQFWFDEIRVTDPSGVR
ncbi:MAG: glycoside hydrolase family 5 protein [Phycisphaerales bacterium]